jgi:hypothetical protein
MTANTNTTFVTISQQPFTLNDYKYVLQINFERKHKYHVYTYFKPTIFT